MFRMTFSLAWMVPFWWFGFKDDLNSFALFFPFIFLLVFLDGIYSVQVTKIKNKQTQIKQQLDYRV